LISYCSQKSVPLIDLPYRFLDELWLSFVLGVIKIHFLYSRDCPSHKEALERLRKVLFEEHVETSVDVIEVKTDEQATELKFPGSPTILINGHDINPQPTQRYSLSCRAYQLEDGRISPLPSIGMIRNAIRAAIIMSA
jgi:hypothetical protein